MITCCLQISSEQLKIFQMPSTFDSTLQWNYRRTKAKCSDTSPLAIIWHPIFDQQFISWMLVFMALCPSVPIHIQLTQTSYLLFYTLHCSFCTLVSTFIRSTADFKDPSKDPSLTNIDPIHSTNHILEPDYKLSAVQISGFFHPC
jgi:hypothetical protein